MCQATHNAREPNVTLMSSFITLHDFILHMFWEGLALAVLGTVKLVAYNFVPRDYLPCKGGLVQISSNTALFSLLGTTYGGDGRTTFGLPNLQTRVPIHASGTHRQGSDGGAPTATLSIAQMPEHTHPVVATTDTATTNDPTGHILASSVRGAANYALATAGAVTNMDPNSIGSAGGTQAHENMQPFLTLQYVICAQGTYPSHSGGSLPDEGEEYLADVKPYGFNFVPRGWAACDGQILPIDQNQSLFALLGTAYGGDGRKTFALPDLRGRTPIGEGTLSGYTYLIGNKGGQEGVELSAQEIPNHDHQGELVNATAGSGTAQDNMIAGTPNVFTSGALDADLHSSAIGAPKQHSEPHPNMMPFQTVNYCICMSGLFPSRN